VDELSLQRLEFDRVLLSVAEAASCEAARRRIVATRPIADPAVRDAELRRLDEAIHRVAEPGTMCETGRGDPLPRLDADATAPLDGEALAELVTWLDAAASTRAAWEDEASAARHPALAAAVAVLPLPVALRTRLAAAIDADGRVRDSASPRLARARAELAAGERDVQERLERWARSFGENAYVTRYGERFVALVPAAGFPRKRGIVHDTSGSGQSLFVEPLELCDENNRLTERRATAAEEERRVLAELAALIDAERPALLAMLEGLVHLDTLRARARWASRVGAVAIAPHGDRLRLVGARHPLLAAGPARDRVVPLDLTLGGTGRLLLVSGPNMGGKTVLLKTVGLAVALAHAAMPVPAREGSAIPGIRGIRVDLGDDQSLDRGLSTFAAHLERLATMAEEAADDRLLLVDELGAGTDPEEGAALGRALIERFAERGAWGVVTTHLGSLKRIAGEIPGVVHGSLEFDLEAMRPRYRFVPGVPGASHALALAERLGLPAAVLARARALTPDEARALERLLAELTEVRAALDAEREALATARRIAETEAAAHHAAAEEAKRTLAELTRGLTRESAVVLGHARELWQTVQREARRADHSRADAERLRAALGKAETECQDLERAADAALAAVGGAPAPSGPPPELSPGQRVRIRDLGVEAELVAGPDAEGRVQLRRGAWSIQSHVSRLEAAAEAAATTQARPGVSWEAPAAEALDVDLRGMEVEEALAEVDRGLDRGVLTGFGEMRIVHGVGRGILRAAVERHLRGHPQVASQRAGAVGEGGRGVTIVRLR
jgi:DNA mismatch repair protein MutS2